eukprot:IDg6020t1
MLCAVHRQIWSPAGGNGPVPSSSRVLRRPVAHGDYVSRARSGERGFFLLRGADGDLYVREGVGVCFAAALINAIHALCGRVEANAAALAVRQELLVQ